MRFKFVYKFSIFSEKQLNISIIKSINKYKFTNFY